MKAIILYDTRSEGGSTDRFVESLGKSLAETGAYVEKGKCKATADYSFIQDFDVVIMGAPVYYMLVSSELLGSFFQSNLKKYLNRKKVALFLTCGSPEPMAYMMYLPQLKMHLVRNKILTEKVFTPAELSDNQAIDDYVDNILHAYKKALKTRNNNLIWADDAQELLAQIPSFFRNRIKIATEEYAEEMGYREITVAVIDEAKAELE
ncbi:protochlorophyllide oxidoreductase [Prosthecochloris marina]|uniref:Protochlorophyllide oxidoreductase n=1 Tax=Prosthecochloris marina TaxID=2017681 RepID=A0A317T613_9CHLB|nr:MULTISPECIES: flavodoxin domain-containing protein [Prosthecochloris]PWW82114.1 protochlorophyllide oxidoreductase [Prosthecochloris marina]UZJ39735.1 protochlorophyllide oxidoreductase [Prosthecochloris sp. SCSIO W1102]